MAHWNIQRKNALHCCQLGRLEPEKCHTVRNYGQRVSSRSNDLVQSGSRVAFLLEQIRGIGVTCSQSMKLKRRSRSSIGPSKVVSSHPSVAFSIFEDNAVKV